MFWIILHQNEISNLFLMERSFNFNKLRINSINYHLNFLTIEIQNRLIFFYAFSKTNTKTLTTENFSQCSFCMKILHNIFVQHKI